jgi:SAM-dependent methyltransferase
MNYGYAEIGDRAMALTLDESDEPHRLPIQMYHHLASAIKLEGLDVMEMSCGRGGGAAFLNRYHHPRSFVGIDRTPQAIRFCRHKHVQPGLTFLQGDAEAIDFGDQCFDAVINVEASHLYGHVEKFLAEVYRVLRPGGYFLLADKRISELVQLLNRQIDAYGWKVISRKNISANVLESIRLQSEERVQTLQRLLPAPLADLVIHQIGADGSHLANALASGESVYQSFVIRKV